VYKGVTLGSALLLAGCASAPTSADSIDRVASEFMRLGVAVSVVDSEMVESVLAAPEVVASAKAERLDEQSIIRQLGELSERAVRIPVPRDQLQEERLRRLRAYIVSLRTQLMMKNGLKLPIVEDVRRNFGFEPVFPPLSAFDSTLQSLDRRLTGSGDVAAKIDALRERSIVPKERVRTVFAAALAECKRRAALHLEFPPGESVEVRFSENPLFPGQNIYVGNGHSIAEISLAKPAEVDRILALACHEIYPGHHLHFATLYHEYFDKRGWSEFAIEPASSPQIPVAEAVAEYGIGLTFPPEERVRFEQATLFPLAGITMTNPGEWQAYFEARSGILGASSTVARDYLEGRLSRESAIEMFRRYRLQSRSAAEQMTAVLDAIGSYGIASDLGWMTIDRAFRGKTLEERWKLFARIEHEPMLLADIERLR